MPAAFTQASRPPERRPGVLGERAHRRLVPDVELGGDRRGSERRCGLAGRFGVDVGDDHRRSGLGEPGATGAPDAASAAGDDRHLPRQGRELGEGAGRRRRGLHATAANLPCTEPL